nr:hypothetical protein [Paraburkholderia sp. BL8N3]
MLIDVRSRNAIITGVPDGIASLLFRKLEDKTGCFFIRILSEQFLTVPGRRRAGPGLRIQQWAFISGTFLLELAIARHQLARPSSGAVCSTNDPRYCIAQGNRKQAEKIAVAVLICEHLENTMKVRHMTAAGLLALLFGTASGILNNAAMAQQSAAPVAGKTNDGSVSAAVVDVGSFLGIAAHRVGTPVQQFKQISPNMILPGASKDG